MYIDLVYINATHELLYSLHRIKHTTVSLLLSCRAFDYDTQCVLYILVDMNNINIDYVCVTHTNMQSDTHT